MPRHSDRHRDASLPPPPSPRCQTQFTSGGSITFEAWDKDMMSSDSLGKVDMDIDKVTEGANVEMPLVR
jgi:hypothetical protein